MYKGSKKGEFMLDILLILILIILFFSLQGGLNSMVGEMTTLTNDTLIIFMLNAFLGFFLLGIGRYVLGIGREA